MTEASQPTAGAEPDTTSSEETSMPPRARAQQKKGSDEIEHLAPLYYMKDSAGGLYPVFDEERRVAYEGAGYALAEKGEHPEGAPAATGWED